MGSEKRLRFDANQPARRRLAAKLVALTKSRVKSTFESALLAINSDFETITPDTLEDWWDKAQRVDEALRGETDELERARLSLMLAYCYTVIGELKAL